MKRFISLITAGALALGTTTAFAQESGAPTGTETVTVTVEPNYSSGDTYSDGVLNYTELADGNLEVAGTVYSNVTEVAIPAEFNGKKVTSIGERAFSNCWWMLTSVTIPDSVTSIGERAFSNCKLTSITIPDSVKIIGERAFAGCDGLTSVTIPNSVTNIELAAFLSCDGLKNVTVSGGVKVIGKAAFQQCDKLETITIMNGVESIEEGAFALCGELLRVYLPKSLKKIGKIAFMDCAKLTDIYFAGTETEWKACNCFTCSFSGTNPTVHYNSANAAGSVIGVDIKAPDNTVDISGCTVKISGDGVDETLVLGNGTLDVSKFKPGTYTFTFKANNCVPRTYKVTVSDDATTGLESGVELHLYGDINGDGKINTTDILKAKLQTKGSNKLDGYDLVVADANKDGKVNGTDVLKLKLHAKGSTKLW